MKLYRLVYYSTNKLVGGDAVAANLKQIVGSSIRENSNAGISGGLVFNRSHFTQVLEGGWEAVSGTFARICRDPRHDNIVLVESKTIEKRAFDAWSMGCVAGESDLLAQLIRRYCKGRIFRPQTLTGDQLAAFVHELISKERHVLSTPALPTDQRNFEEV